MRFSQLLSAAFAFSTVVYGQLADGQNSITYPLGGTLDSSTLVPIRWTPTTTGTITIKLLKGPPANILAIDVIAASIENSGSFTWTISNSLQDSGSMPAGDRYGFKIIDDLTGTFEYSPPFDLSVPDSTFGATSLAPASSTPTPSVTPQSTSATFTSSLSAIITSNSTYSSTVTPVPTTNSTQLGSSLTTTTSTTATHSSTLVQPSNTRTQSDDTGSETKPGLKMSIIIGVVCGVAGGLILAVVALTMILRRKSRRKMRSSPVMLNKRSPSLLYSDSVYSRV